VSTPALSTTSYAILGLLAIKPWSSYELTQQMDRSLGRIWPRATSKLYEEPKKLVAHGFATSDIDQAGRRPRTMYTITPKGRAALSSWLAEPGEGPVLEYGQLVKVFFAENGSTDSLRATLAAAQDWARARCAESLAVATEYAHGTGPFPQRTPELELVSRFITDFYRLVGEWAHWASGIVSTWPDDPRQARHDPAEIAETLRRAAEGTHIGLPHQPTPARRGKPLPDQTSHERR
jgi:DNA-binding PadR family transcriptional regulator